MLQREIQYLASMQKSGGSCPSAPSQRSCFRGNTEGSAGALSHRLAAREMSFISPRHITNNYNFNFSGGDSSAGLAQSKDSSRRFMQTMQVNRDDSFIHALREAANTSSSNRTSHAH